MVMVLLLLRVRSRKAADMPYILTFSVGTSDAWLRAICRGDEQPPDAGPFQRVIVESFAEKERLVAKMAQLKFQRSQPYGGCEAHRWPL